MKAKLQAVREEAKILEQERFKMVDLQIEVDAMQMDIVKTYHLEFCSQEMEGDITPVLAILDERMKKWI